MTPREYRKTNGARLELRVPAELLARLVDVATASESGESVSDVARVAIAREVRRRERRKVAAPPA